MSQIHPVILCGGSGTRLWPLSRKALPKPFLPLVSAETLFEQAVRRVAGDDRFAALMVVAGAAHGDVILAQLGDAPGARLVVEPCARNTAPAIALAAALLPEDAVMLVCPSDHHIADPAAFRAAALAAAELARQDYLVSFGIAPDRPETGYGYLQHGDSLPGGYAIARFVEKPDLARAQEYLASGNFSWNGGIFAFRAGHLLAELAAYRPEMARLVRQAVAEGREDGACFHPAAAPFAAIAGDSIDYAVMENTARAAMVPVEMGWSDIGNWAALADALAQTADDDGNIGRGGRVDLDQCRGVFALTDGLRISAVGLEDVCIIVSGDEVLVTTRDGAQRVGKLPGAVNQ
ncbi:mannose-1-phosphate guanylyltransferase [Erythrobacter sanguineus]|uniref:Mannose-1-phosphate guanylyltransferase / mannose-6-phosphate isomerase n=1 Tax=Erythrobacter sanguineus TaxID=198312 RepID=A0A1M7SSV5_9SPHN|nr:sugar phosphate nucleotidyltransferase [Erythrobacter sanguineus]SHN61627.1 mannose-1-phosphate guanylyltransferase / mannose-6-phosphate isomerase [Erythrobacter sanguineus]